MICDLGRNLSKALHQYAGAEHRIWIAGTVDNPINQLLMGLLSQRFKIDASMSSADLGIYCLNPKF